MDERLLATALSLVALICACGGSTGNSARSCAVSGAAPRPVVQLSWEIEHATMDSDPPIAKVTLVVRGPKDERLALGDFEGTCKPVELGAPADRFVSGAGVAELSCDHQGKAMHARVVQESEAEIIVRRYERAGEGAGLSNVREVARLPVPACATFTSEVQQTSEL